MPSHTGPVVAVPVSASMSCLLVGHGQSSRSGMRAASSNWLLARRPERVGEHDQEDHDEIGEPPGLGELGERAIGLDPLPCAFSGCWLCRCRA